MDHSFSFDFKNDQIFIQMFGMQNYKLRIRKGAK